jgi:hypothetical protein
MTGWRMATLEMGAWWVLALLAGCGGGDGGAGPAPCNGGAELCDRPYDQVSVVCTHNAMGTEADGFLIPTANQVRPILEQLDDGVRCLMLDSYMDEGEPMLCHAACLLGKVPFVPLLEDIDAWLVRHPDQVVTFIMEAYISEAETEQALREAGIFERVYHHAAPPGSPWPTLGEMIGRGEQLVVLTDDSQANGEWHLDWRAYGWETPFNDDTFTCAPGRGDPTRYDHQPFILNHYTLCPLGGCEENGVVNNAFDFLYPRALDCWQDTDHNPFGHIPTFINVDHYHVPESEGAGGRPQVFDAVDALNAAWPSP